MGRRPKTDRVPRTRAGGEWTEAAFWGFIRSQLRLMSRAWPPRKNVMVNHRRKYDGPNKRQKWEYQCSGCGGWFAQKQLEIDHIEPCGQLKSFEDIGPFVQRLLCEEDGLRVLCESCHDKRRGEK